MKMNNIPQMMDLFWNFIFLFTLISFFILITMNYSFQTVKINKY